MYQGHNWKVFLQFKALLFIGSRKGARASLLVAIHRTICIHMWLSITMCTLSFLQLSAKNNAQDNANTSSFASPAADPTSLSSTANCISSSLHMLEDYNMSIIFSESDKHHAEVQPVLPHSSEDCEYLPLHHAIQAPPGPPHYPQQSALQPPQYQSQQEHQQQSWQQPLQPPHNINNSNAEAASAPTMVQLNQRRLPAPCPIPYHCFSEDVIQALDNNQITGIFKIRLLRQAASFYHGICPKPTHDEYVSMAKTLCDHYPQLKDKQPAKDIKRHSMNYVS